MQQKGKEGESDLVNRGPKEEKERRIKKRKKEEKEKEELFYF